MKRAGMLLVGWCALALAAGCGKSDARTEGERAQEAAGSVAAGKPAEASADLSANEILKRLLETYRGAKTYRDQAVVRLAFRQNNQPVFQEQPIAVAFERPDKLSLVAFQATVKCDGKELKAKIEDEATKNVDGQVVGRPAPHPLKLVHLVEDQLLNETISSRLRRQPVQLELLLEAGGLVAAFGSDVACQRLSDSQHAGRNCFRVEVPSPGGAFLFWVDQANSVLLRLDYPVAALVPDLANDPSVSQLELFADLRGASIGQPIAASEFALEVPANAKRMKAFTRPPLPLPTDLFGQQPAGYSFTRLEGTRLADRDLAGKAAVLAWYHDNPACEATLQQVSAAAQRLAKDDSVAFLAVATDPTSLTNDALRRRFSEWKVELPIVRDLEAFGDTSFHIKDQPTIVVLDKRGCVQVFQVGGSPELADQLVEIVERLKRGDDLAGEIVAEYRREREKYEQLVARGGPEPDELLEVPEAVIRKRSEPQKIKVKPLWSCDVENAGNITIGFAPNQPPKLLVLSGGWFVVELDARGKIISRQALKIPEQAAVTFLRTAVDKSGQRLFVAAAHMAPELFVFDAEWKQLLTYPPQGHAPLGVSEVALADLNSDGDLQIVVAAAGGAGVVAVSPEGDVRWRNGKFPAPFSLAVSSAGEGGSPAIFTTFAGEGEKWSIGRLNRFGKDEPPLTVGNWSIVRVFGGHFPAKGQGAILGLATNAKSEPFAVGLNAELAERWNYPLPLGVHQNPIEPITSSQVLPGYDGEWWIAGPDGSVHLVTADGKLFDSFFTGAPLTGIAATKFGERPVLLLSNGTAVTAWEIEMPAKAKRSVER